VVEAVAWDVTGDVVDFNETNNGQSSSALALGLHATTYPDIRVTDVVKRETSRLEDVIDLEALGPIGLVNLDIQGAELRALKGFGAHVSQAQAVYSEINRVELYEGCDLFPQLNAWLEARGFSCVDWELLPEGWGDALWLRRDCIPIYPRSRRRARLALKGTHRAMTTARQLPARARASAKRRLGLF
jgi:hypothetical protein